MDGFFPAQTLSLFLVFESCFTAPSFAYFRAYVWALMVVEGRKCMTRLARCAFFHQRDLSSWERFLAEHKPRQHIRYTSAELTRPYSAPLHPHEKPARSRWKPTRGVPGING